MGGSNWEPDREQETLFGEGKTQERRLTKSYINSLYQELSSRTSDATHYMITLDAKASGFTSKAGMSHSPMSMEI